MGFREDKIKVLEIICAKLPPSEIVYDVQEIYLNEKDFEREDLSFNSALLLIKDMYNRDFFKSLSHKDLDDGTRGIIIKINPEVDWYTLQFKYPETELGYEEKEIMPTKIFIIVDGKKGIYQEDGQGGSYKIKIPSKRMELIKLVGFKNKIIISEIEKELNQKQTLIIKEINKINEIFRTKLSVVDDLIIHIPTSGYTLNKDCFNIKFIQ